MDDITIYKVVTEFLECTGRWLNSALHKTGERCCDASILIATHPSEILQDCTEGPITFIVSCQSSDKITDLSRA